MLKDHYAPGEPCWVDCGTDVDKAAAFYAGLFDWTVTDLGEAAGGYRLASLGDARVAGIGPQQSPGAPYWSVYFSTHDAAKSAESVLAHGGTVLVEPIDVGEQGTMAVFADPQGAAFSVWQPAAMHGFGLVDEAGAFCWPELLTSDVDAATAFYRGVFGWGAQASEDNSMEYTEFQLGVTSVAGVMPRPDTMPADAPPCWSVYFAVDDADATVARVAELGGSTMVGPKDIPVGRFAVCLDSVGAVFNVITMSAG